jgi:hypothetical protein
MRYPGTHALTGIYNRFLSRLIIAALFQLSFLPVNSQINWTWMSGDNSANSLGVYGTKGTAAPPNKPGNRDSHCSWKDAAGNLWLFGGWDINGRYFNDLWKYNVATGQWTWMSGDNTVNSLGVYGTKGTAAAANKPGARYGQTSWTDASGNFWLFGGKGFDAAAIGYLNDLWMYSPSTNQWTWVSGDNTRNSAGSYGGKGTAAAGNKPGGRYYEAGWKDAAGNFWIFAGKGYDKDGSFNCLNDLWKYNPGTGQWTWVSGDNTINSTGVYGTKGTAAAANVPGNRNMHSGWADPFGNCWIFGGRDNSNNLYNDLWKYNTSTGQWTWVSGDNTVNNNGTYGTLGTGATTNKPGARYGQSVVVDTKGGNFWFFGGYGNSSAGSGALNDLWAFSPGSGKWTWVSGDNTAGSAGTFGTKGTAAATNKTPGKAYSTIWLDASSNIWVFGGWNIGSYDYNDLFKFSSVSILPIQELSIRGTHRDHENVLYWATKGELNTDQFIIERSANGIDYNSIGAMAAAGSGEHQYSFTDNQATAATCYYRIRVQDVNGQTYYSPVVTLAGSAGGRISVYPNPTVKGVIVRLSDNSLLNTTARLYDATGRLVREMNITSTEQYIDLHSFGKGIFMLTLNNGKTFTIIKE